MNTTNLHYTSLSDFSLQWRFNDSEKYAQLTDDELLRFKPLAEETSETLWRKHIYPLSDETADHLMKLHVYLKVDFRPIMTISEKEDNKIIKNELRKNISINDSTTIYFFWSASVAVQSDWGLFLKHWDDFCYPSDDSNIVIIPDYNKAVLYIEDKWYIIQQEQNKPLFKRSSNKAME